MHPNYSGSSWLAIPNNSNVKNSVKLFQTAIPENGYQKLCALPEISVHQIAQFARNKGATSRKQDAKQDATWESQMQDAKQDAKQDAEWKVGHK